MYLFTDGWVVMSEHPLYDKFSNLSEEEKRIYHLIDELQLPTKELIRIYQKAENVVVAVREVYWRFCKNRFFQQSKFRTILTVAPKKVYCSDVQETGRILCQHFGYNLRQHMTKPMLRKILKQGAELCKTLEEPVGSFPYGISPYDIEIYTDNSELFLKKLGKHRELYDLFIQARKLNRVIKTSWSDRKIHDVHMKWTEEIHKIKCRNCTSDPIWENIPTLPSNVELLNSQRRIADEGFQMHHCIFTNYSSGLVAKRRIAFHVNCHNPITVMFDYTSDNSVKFNQAYHAWNKPLTEDELQLTQELEKYAMQIYQLNNSQQTAEENDSQLIF